MPPLMGHRDSKGKTEWTGMFGPMFMALALAFLPTLALGEETLVVKVVLNGEDQGEHFVVRSQDGKMLMRVDDLRGMRFERIPVEAVRDVEGIKYLPLESFAPGVTYALNERKATIDLTADPSLLGKQTFDFSLRGQDRVPVSGVNSGFVNYAVNYTYDDLSRSHRYSLPWEIGASLGGNFLFSNFLYRSSGEDKGIVRQNTSVTRDDIPNLKRYIIGDITAVSGETGGFLGGVSVSRNFGIDPYTLRYTPLSLSGFTATPVDAEILVNGITAQKVHLSPGPFDFSSLPFATGSGSATLVLRDAFGRERKIEYPFYVVTTLLLPGLHDYSYNLGFRRKNLGKESFDYGTPAFIGYHRYGFTKDLTAGVHWDVDSGFSNAGPTAQFLLGGVGVFGVAGSASIRDGKDGYSGSIAYNYSGGNIGFGATFRGSTRDYTTVDRDPPADKPRLEGLANVGLSSRLLGSLSTTFAYTERYDNSKLRRGMLSYSRPLFKIGSLNIIASRTVDEGTSNEISAGVTLFLSQTTSGRVEYRVKDGQGEELASLQRNAPLGTGYGYRLEGKRSENSLGESEVAGRAAAEYRARTGIISAGYRREADSNAYDANVSGGIAAIDGSLHLTRPIYNAFGLVKVGGVEGVKVSYSNQPEGNTDKKGELIIPNLISYQGNRIGIDDKDIPVEYTVREKVLSVAPPFRGGAVARFEVARLQAFTGHLYFGRKGERIPAEYAGLEVQLPDRPIEVVVATAGEFYLENLPPGKWPARIFLGERSCKFDLSVPKSDELFVEMGDIVCETN